MILMMIACWVSRKTCKCVDSKINNLCFPRTFSNVWKLFRQFFQPLEKDVAIFPMLGNVRAVFISTFSSSVAQCPTGRGLIGLNHERNRYECLEGCIEME